MIARVLCASPWGVDAVPIHVEVDAHDVHNGLASFDIEGLPDRAVRETRELVRSAIRHSGFDLPLRKIHVRLDPVEQKKESSACDLAIATALLAALGEVPVTALDGLLVCGQLALDGTVRVIRGGLSIAEVAAQEGAHTLVVPKDNAAEAAALGAVTVLPVRTLAELVEHLTGISPITPFEPTPHGCWPSTVPDFCEVRGNETVKRVLEVAAAGAHHVLMGGPPGASKSLLARRLPGILPPLERDEAIELTKIASMVADEPPSGLVYHRPFRAPHPGASAAAITGGGSLPRPGEVTLAHGGVLLLDELPEFRRDTLEALRRPLDEGRTTIVRTRFRLDMPARFILVAAMSGCPCAAQGNPERACTCSPERIRRYRSRIPETLLRHIDLHVEALAPSRGELRARPSESSAEIAVRVLQAREIQERRFLDRPSITTNAAIPPADLARDCPLDASARQLFDLAIQRLQLDEPAQSRVLRVARTLSDLEGVDPIGAPHVAEAIQYRPLPLPE